MPDPGSSLAAWLTRLETLSAREIELGLERVEAVLERLALTLPDTVLHVAGTNGKGSCVAILEGLLRQSGRRVGSYTSPHLLRYNERIRIDASAADDAAIIAAFERVEAVRGDIPLTYFEYGTVAALVEFARQSVDVAVLEVGMGGRLDAVNALEPTAGLITNVALDHCEWLGADVEAIAAEKAGIMRNGRPIVFGARNAPPTIERHAARIGARLYLAGRDYDWVRAADTWTWSCGSRQLTGLVRPALPGAHQFANAAAALTLLEAAGFGELLEKSRVDAVLQALHLEGRMQRLEDDRRWLLDVAHNPAAAEALAATLDAQPVEGRTVAIIGLLADKDIAEIVRPLADIVEEWIVVTADSPRARSAAELARELRKLTGAESRAVTSFEAAVDQARTETRSEDRILVTGSFYVVGPVLSELYSRRTS